MTGHVHRAVGWSFTVEADQPAVARHLDHVLRDLRVQECVAAHHYRLLSPRGVEPGRLLLDEQELATSVDEALLYRTLLWHVNRGVEQASVDHVLLHASAAELDGRAVVLAAPMESGKTTLVAGLVCAGLRYLTDETVAVRPDDLRLVPYPKALSVDEGSWPVLAALEPQLPPDVRHLAGEQWQVPVSTVPSAHLSEGAVAALVVLPRYVEGGPTALSRISPSETLVELLHQTFAPERAPERDFRVLARLVRSAECYRLTVGDLDDAVALLLSGLGRRGAGG